MEFLDKCDCKHVHKESVDLVRKFIINDDEAYRLSEFFKVFSDNNRIKIMNALINCELCVCDLAEIMNMSQSATSHQLKVLRQAKLVKPRREGKTIFYSLDDEHIKDILVEGLEHIREEVAIYNE